jgi:hypothetical protein
MSVSRSDTERRYPLEGSGAKTEFGIDPDKWPARWSLLFIIGASCFLWGGIIYAAALIF